MIDDEELLPADLVGRRLLKVTTAWHHYADDDPSLVHLWLHLEGLGPVVFHTPSTGLSLRVEQPHGPYAMDEYGRVSVADDPPDVPMARFVGQPIRSVRQIEEPSLLTDFLVGAGSRPAPDTEVHTTPLTDPKA
ncbi:hypothetical protein ACFQ6N_01190 [Kitasatospora sp. NPDC056446]|uniref:hypothetical protein n=1 Tax=Kitasatospora sp. NPDC056446 TaxID=3345819 RepID=UPI0036CE80C4